MLKDLLLLCRERQASDLHLVQGEPPILRIYGKLHRAPFPVLSNAQLNETLVGMMTPTQRELFERVADVDFSYSLPETDRFRVNVHRQRGAVEGAFRRLPAAVPTLKELGLPLVVNEFTRLPSGLVLVTGPVGTGKSTTLAAIIEQINRERSCLVISIEDPIEYQHVNKKAVIKQREISVDTPSFESALRHALRQDPNVLVIGEMRDLETITIALTAAETGHLVLATLHTPDATQSLQRMIDVFPRKNRARCAFNWRIACRLSSRSNCCRARPAWGWRWPPKCWSPRPPCATSSASNSASKSPLCCKQTPKSVCIPWTPR